MSATILSSSKLYSAVFFCLLVVSSRAMDLKDKVALPTVATELRTGLTGTGTSFYPRLQGQESSVDPALAYPQQQQSYLPGGINSVDELPYNGIVPVTADPAIVDGYGPGYGAPHDGYGGHRGTKQWGGFGRKNGYVGGRPDVQHGLKY